MLLLYSLILTHFEVIFMLIFTYDSSIHSWAKPKLCGLSVLNSELVTSCISCQWE